MFEQAYRWGGERAEQTKGLKFLGFFPPTLDMEYAKMRNDIMTTCNLALTTQHNPSVCPTDATIGRLNGIVGNIGTRPPNSSMPEKEV